MRRWYVAHTHAQGEARAQAHLARQGFETWLPLHRRRIRHARRAVTALRPLFPRYYRLGSLCGFVALGVVLLGRAGLSQEELARLTIPVAVAMVASLIGGEWILPRLRDLDGEEERFARLHQVSAMLNTTTLAALVLAVAGAVMR